MIHSRLVDKYFLEVLNKIKKKIVIYFYFIKLNYKADIV